MGPKSIVIILAVVGALYSLALNLVKYLSLDNPTPENLSDVYDAETYAKWKRYSKEHSALRIISTLATGVITIALLSTNVYAKIASLVPNDLVYQILIIIGFESVVGAVLGCVVSYISTMKIEQKYGFNRSTLKTFIVDKIRSFLVGFAFSGFLAFLIAGSHILLGVWMIPVFVAAMFLFTMLVSFLYPLVSRLGNKFTPLEDGELKDSLMKLLDKHGYKVKAIEVMDASRRTTKLNAYFTGFGKMKTIVLYDNLINAMTTEEICAVFAHELGHGLHKDVQKAQVLNIFQFLLIAVMAWAAASYPIVYTYFGFEAINYGFAYILLSVGLGVLQPIISLIMNARSRSAEYKADRQAVVEGYGVEMISAFKKLAKDNFSHLSPSFINVVLEYSHPPLDRRVKMVEKEMKKLEKKK